MTNNTYRPGGVVRGEGFPVPNWYYPDEKIITPEQARAYLEAHPDMFDCVLKDDTST